MIFIITCPHKMVSAEISKFAMEDKCGTLINFAKNHIYNAEVTFLRSPTLLGILGSGSCDLGISSGTWWVEDVSWNQILFQFIDFQNHGESCVSLRQSRDKVDWANSDNKIKGLSDTYCGSSKPPLNKPFITDKYHALVIKFDAASYKDDAWISFSLVANVLHSDGQCSHYECDNGRCIPKELKCSKYNPCGDKSHCRPDGVSVMTIIFIIIGVIAGLILALLVIKYVRCKRLCKSDDDAAVGEEERMTALRDGDERGTTWSTQLRPLDQPAAEPSAPHLPHQNGNDINETNGAVERNDLHDMMLPPPSYEEVMRQES